LAVLGRAKNALDRLYTNARQGRSQVGGHDADQALGSDQVVLKPTLFGVDFEDDRR
jgi:hypothetical protein